MTKTVRKLLVNDLWHIGEHESWFSYLASEGFHLKKMGRLFAHFEKGDPKDMRYRIDTSTSRTISEEEKEFYRQSGWDYVTNFGEFNLFSSPTQLNAPELHTDPAEQSLTLKRFDTKIKTNTIVVVFLSVIMVGIQFAQWFLNTGPFLSLVNGDGIIYITSSIIFLVAAYKMVRGVFSIRKLRSHLIEGRPINHNATWRNSRRANMTFSIGIILLAAFGAVLPWVQIINTDKTLPNEGNQLPIVRLADIERNPGLVLEEFNDGNLFKLNYYRYNWSPFATLQYESSEHGTVQNVKWKDQSGVYSPSIYMELYKLTFPSMKEKLIAELIAINDFFYPEETPIRQENKSFDTLFIHETDGKTDVYAAIGKGVIFVSYYGQAELAVILDSVEEKLRLIAE